MPGSHKPISIFQQGFEHQLTFIQTSSINRSIVVTIGSGDFLSISRMDWNREWNIRRVMLTETSSSSAADATVKIDSVGLTLFPERKQPMQTCEDKEIVIKKIKHK